MVVPSGATRKMSRSASKVWLIWNETVTFPMAPVIPETAMGDSVVVRSGIVVGVLLSNLIAGPTKPVVNWNGIVNVPLAVVTVSVNGMLVPQAKPDEVLIWNEVVFVPVPPTAMSG